MAVTMVQTTLLRNSMLHFHTRAWCSLIPQTWLSMPHLPSQTHTLGETEICSPGRMEGIWPRWHF